VPPERSKIFVASGFARYGLKIIPKTPRSTPAAATNQEKTPAVRNLRCERLEYVSEFWHVALGQQCCPSSASTIILMGVFVGEVATCDGAHRVAANERPRRAQKFGWR
jgi:hypothetical protein